MRHIWGLILVLLLVALASMIAETSRTYDEGQHTIRSGEVVHGGLFVSSPATVTIEEGARVDGAIWASSGVVNVAGEVGGGILSISGDLHLAETAKIAGHVNVTSVPFEDDRGATIEQNLAADVAGWLGGPLGTSLLLVALATYALYHPLREALGAPASGRHIMAVLAAGAVIAIISGVMLLVDAAGIDAGSGAWSVVYLVAGLALVGMIVARGRSLVALAAPAAVLLVLAAILAVHALTGYWQSWAYAWALVLPAAIGAGRLAGGWWTGDRDLVTSGARLAAVGLALFVFLLVLFEGASATAATIVLAAALIALGVYLLAGRWPRTGGRPAGA